MRKALLIFAFAVSACGSAEAPDATGASQEALCSSAPTRNSDGTVTTAACSYEQHTSNIAKHGEALANLTVRGSDGGPVATVSYSCGRYLMGRDLAGTSIIIDRETGKVQSHGALHAGAPTTTLGTLTLPIVVEGR